MNENLKLTITIIAPFITALLMYIIQRVGIKKLTTQVETVTNEFKVLQHQQNTKFTKFHEKRIEVIETMYQKVKDLHQIALRFTAQYRFYYAEQDPDKIFENEKEEFVKCYNDLRTYYNHKDIYLNDSINKLLNKVNEDYGNKVYEYLEPKRLNNLMSGEQNSELYANYRKEAAEKSKKASEYIAVELQKVIDELKIEFLKIIDIDKNN